MPPSHHPFDLDAPIVPNESAAGVRIGEDARSVVERAGSKFIDDPADLVRSYNFGSVILWARAARVHQVGVLRAYRGKVQNQIGLGSTIGDVERAFGNVIEDDDDNLVVPSLPGWCFETEEWMFGDEVHQNRSARIVAIYVSTAA